MTQCTCAATSEAASPHCSSSVRGPTGWLDIVIVTPEKAGGEEGRPPRSGRGHFDRSCQTPLARQFSQLDAGGDYDRGHPRIDASSDAILAHRSAASRP